MRLLFLGVTTVALSGCSVLGIGASSHHSDASHDAKASSLYAHDCCEAAKLQPWNLEATAGVEFLVGGTAITGDQANVGTLGNVVSMSDAYGIGQRYEMGGSYAFSPNRKVTLTGSYATANGKAVNVGSAGGQALTGTFSDYERLGIEAGLRQYFKPRNAPLVKSVRPYVEGRLGAARVDDIVLENAQLGGAAFSGGTLNMYAGGWVPTAAATIGVESSIFKNTTLGLETGIQYTGVLKSDNSELTPGNAFAGINNGGESLSVPVKLRARYRF